MIVPNRRPYDVAMEHNGKLIKVQVKSSINRRSRITKNNKVFHYYEHYNDFDCDIFAFVQPRLYKIAFFHVNQIDVKYRKILKPEQFDEYSIEKALGYM